VAVPLISTVSTFQQLFTSSIQAVNLSSITANIFALNGTSSINGYSIGELVSSVSPPTPAPSTFTQLYTSSLVANGIIGSNFDLNVTSQSIVTVSAGNRLNLNADTCNIAITAPNIQTYTTMNNTVGTGNDYALTATNNISMNASNTAILYTTNTAPTPPSQGIVILGQGNSIFASQIDTTVSAVGTLNLNGASVLVNGAPINTTVTSTFTNLYAYQLSNNPTIGSGAMGILAATQIDMLAPTIQVNASDYLLIASNSFTQSSNTRLQGSNTIAIYNGALPTVAAGGVTVQATNTLNLNGASVLVNGAPIITTVTSTFTNLYAYQLSNNPTVGSGAMGILAATQIDMAAPTIQINATQDYLLFASNSFTQSSNTRLQGSNSIAIYNGALPAVAAGSINVEATNYLNLLATNINISTNTINLNAPSTICLGDIRAVTFNGAPLPTSGNVTSTFTQLNTNILSNNPAISNDLKIRAGNAIVLNDLGETTISLGGSLEVQGAATGGTNIQTNYFNSLNSLISFSAYNTLDLLSLSSLTVTGQSSINLTSSNINLYTPSTICAGDIRAVTFNGLPLPTSGGGGGSVTSTFSTVFTNVLSNNPAIGNDLLLKAENAIVMGNDAGFVSISLGDSLDIMGTSGETNIYSEVLNSLNSIISFSAYNTLDLASVSSLTVTGQSSINISSSNITLDAPKVKLDVDDVNIYSFGSQSFRFVKENPYNYLQTVGRPMIITGLGGADSAFSFDGTGNNKSFRTLDMNANPITFGASGGDIYQINTAFWANGGTAQGYGGSLYLGASNSVFFQVPVGFQNSGTPLDMNNNNITNLSSITSAVTTMTLSNTTNIDINAPTINVGGAVNVNCNAISKVGAFSRFMISTDLPQPVIQYGYVSTAAAFSGTVTITLPQRYTSVNSYIPFAVVQNDATTTFYVSTITRATFEIGWSGYTGFSDNIFSWNTLGT
jgi:hypothetical protein